MTRRAQRGMGDARAVSRLTIAGIVGVVEIVEAMHLRIARIPGIAATPAPRTTGITGLVYRRTRGVVHSVGRTLDGLLARIEPLLGEQSTWRGRETLLAVLNGVLGDYLEASNNPLAITMRIRRAGLPLPDERA